MLLPHISIYIKIYQFNKMYGKGVGLQVRKLSYSHPPFIIINGVMSSNETLLNIKHIKTIFNPKLRWFSELGE